MTASAEVPSAEDPSAEDRGPGAEPRQDLPPEEHRPDERRKMTVSERDIGTLAADLEGWLAGRLGHPEGLTVSGVRHAIVMARIKRRMIHFGEDEVPAERDDYVLHRASLEQLLAGSYRWD